jgi:hypothetical protein
MIHKLSATQIKAVFIALVAQVLFSPVTVAAADRLYEVLSPWAEVDPKPLRGISPRLAGLEGKKIGLFANYKRAARPIVAEVEKRLKERFPGIQTSLYDSRGSNVLESETENKARFEAWAKEVDAVVAAVGD